MAPVARESHSGALTDRSLAARRSGGVAVLTSLPPTCLSVANAGRQLVPIVGEVELEASGA